MVENVLIMNTKRQERYSCLHHLNFKDIIIGFSYHCPLILGALLVEKGWIPFKFMDCWLHHQNFKDIIKDIWDEACKEFSGQFKVIKKLSSMATQLR